jgi:hypothetical protein
LLFVAAAGATPEAIVFPRHFAETFAVSSGGRITALVGVAGSSVQRLMVVGPGTAGSRMDLTEAFTGFPLSEVVQVSVSLSGDVVALGSRAKIVVLEVAQHKIIYAANGYDPSLSPDGAQIAFRDNKLGFLIRDFKDGASRRVLPWTRVGGLGGWSPDGKYLLTGAFGSFSVAEELLAIDSSSGNSCVVMANIGHDDVGGRFAWVSRAYLSP